MAALNIGFTGTQYGPNYKQQEELKKIITAGKTFHHGDCVGADEYAAHIAIDKGIWTIGHIPDNPKKRAFVNNDEEREPKPYLNRNKDIVDETDVLVATPQTQKEITRSGTWHTIRNALKQNKHVIIIYPDGSVKEFNK